MKVRLGIFRPIAFVIIQQKKGKKLRHNVKREEEARSKFNGFHNFAVIKFYSGKENR